LRKLMLQR
uniref:Echinometrin n=1 Tax=Echinometra lucunter TaxID=105361 RepID=ECHMN_ECHLU|nr:RecName: Full=Echinometrin [Echinometra lucunter]